MDSWQQTLNVGNKKKKQQQKGSKNVALEMEKMWH